MLKIQRATMPALFDCCSDLLLLGTSRRVLRQEANLYPLRGVAYEPPWYIGKTVLLGGHILEVQKPSREDEDRRAADPARISGPSGARDKSEERFVDRGRRVSDPEVYRNDLGSPSQARWLDRRPCRSKVTPTRRRGQPWRCTCGRRRSGRRHRGPYYDPFYLTPISITPFSHPYYPRRPLTISTAPPLNPKRR